MNSASQQALIDAQRFTNAIWGRAEGWAAVFLGHGGNYLEGGYEFKGTEQAFARWPSEADSLLPDLLDLSQDLDVFIAPLLRAQAHRRQGFGIPGRFLYADVDHGDTPPTTHQQGRLRQLTSKPGTLLVNSGSSGHVHAYLPLAEVPNTLADFVMLNRRFAHTIGADAGWADNKILRLPGTLNHKSRARGHDSQPVTMLVVT